MFLDRNNNTKKAPDLLGLLGALAGQAGQQKNLAWGNFVQSSEKQVWAEELLPPTDPQDAIKDEPVCNCVWVRPSKNAPKKKKKIVFFF